MAAFGIGDPIATVIYAIMVVLVIYWLISNLGAGTFGTLGNLRLK